MILEKAKPYAEKIKSRLEKYAEAIDITGEVRREVNDIREIELIMVIEDSQHVEFNNFLKRLRDLNIGMLVNNHTSQKTVMWKDADDLYLPSKIWIANRSNYGINKLLTTGTTHFNRYILAKWKEKTGGHHGGYGVGGFSGIYSQKGMNPLSEYLRTRTDEVVDIYNEEEVFKKIGLEFIEPKKRSEWI